MASGGGSTEDRPDGMDQAKGGKMTSRPGRDSSRGVRMALAAGAALAASLAVTAPAGAAGPAELAQRLGPDASVAAHPETGKARFVGTRGGRPIPRAAGIAPTAGPETAARGFLRANGADFGLRDQAVELRATREHSPAPGRSSVRFEQVHRGVPVVGGELIVNVDDKGNVLSAGGEVVPDLEVGVTPAVTAAQAEATALAAIAKAHGVAAGTLSVSGAQRAIFDPRLLDAPGPGGARLVWRMEVRSRRGDPIRELVLLDAAIGKIALHFNQIANARNRQICDGQNIRNAHYPCTAPVRIEGGAPHAVQDVNLAYDYSGDTYDFLQAPLRPRQPRRRRAWS